MRGEGTTDNCLRRQKIAPGYGRKISSVRESFPHQPQRGGAGDAALSKMNA
jgi:hypothetical protein